MHLATQVYQYPPSACWTVLTLSVLVMVYFSLTDQDNDGLWGGFIFVFLFPLSILLTPVTAMLDVSSEMQGLASGIFSLMLIGVVWSIIVWLMRLFEHAN